MRLLGTQRHTVVWLVLGTCVVVAILIGAALAVRVSPGLAAESRIVLSSSVTKCSTGAYPTFPGYDEANQELYIPNSNSGTVTVLSGKCTYVGNVTLPSKAEPIQATFCPQTDDMWVTDANLNQIYIISGLSIVKTITAKAGQLHTPWGVAYDPEFLNAPPSPVNTGGMLVTNYGTDTVSEFQTGLLTKPGSYYGSATVGMDPIMVAFDPQFDQVLVTNYLSDSVSVLNGGSLVLAYNGTVGSNPYVIAIDPDNDLVFVTNYGSSNVSVLFGGPGGTDTSFSGASSALGLAYDQTTQRMMFVNSGNGDISTVSPGLVLTLSRYKEPAAAGINGVAWDGANGDMYVTAGLYNLVYIIS